MRFGRLASLATAAALLSTSPDAFGLDKQGSAHGGQVGGDAEEFNVSGAFSLGAALYNPSYAARPDNTGLALFRYVAHTELSVWHDYLSIGVDGTFFSDRRGGNVVAPSELDLTYEVIGRYNPFEVHLAYERDMPIDRGGLVQSFIYALFVYGFDFKHAPKPLETRGTIPSP